VTDGFDSDDIAAMRKQGDLRDFMRSRIRKTSKPTKPPAWKPPPGHKPGAWPPGTGPVRRGDPLAEWGPEWDAALDDIRHLIATEGDES